MVSSICLFPLPIILSLEFNIMNPRCNTRMGLEDLPKKLRENLEPDEQVLYYTKKNPSLEKPKWLVVTDRRLIYFDEKILGRYDMMSIPYEKIERIDYVRGIASADFKITLEDGTVVELGWMRKKQGQEAMEAIKEAIEAIAIEPPTLEKKKGLTREEWVLVKPKEAVVRGARGIPEYRARLATRGGRPVAQREDDVYDELLKLKRLRDEGIISEEEYEEKRRKLLDKI